MSIDHRAPLGLRIGAAVRSVGALLDGDDGLAELVNRLATAATHCVPCADYCGVVISTADVTFTAAATSGRVTAVDAYQFDTGNGPCLHAARTGETVVVDCTVDDDRWPGFVAAARAVGIMTMTCTPIRSAGQLQSVGSLTLFSTTAHAPDTVDTAAAVGLLVGAFEDALARHTRVRTLQSAIDGLREATAHRAPIEQAKGILMALRGIDEDAAFAALVRESQNSNRRVREVARAFVADVAATSPDIPR